jgi:hypothetical protein
VRDVASDDRRAVNTDKFKVGFFSFTEVTDPNEHHSYNEWHMLDHMPEQYPIAGIAYGQRWVSTPECASARAVSEAPLDAVHYVTWYLMTEPVETTLQEFYEHGRALAKSGRFHQHRRALLSGPFRLLDGVAAPRVLIRAEAVPFRPHRGIYVVVEDAGTGDAPAHEAALMDVPGIAGLWSFVSGEASDTLPWNSGEQRITVAWLDVDPCTVAAAIASIECSRAGVTFAGPFATITPWEWTWFDTAE